MPDTMVELTSASARRSFRSMAGATGWVALALCAVLGLGGAAPNAPPPVLDSTPFLRIETGMHEAAINRLLALPREGRLITVSDDKTARAWRLDTLAPDGVIRPPVGPGDDGALYAVAANDNLIFLAGRMPAPDGGYAVNLVRRATLQPIGNLSLFPHAIVAMKISPSGKELAVGMKDGGGVKVIDLEARRPVIEDRTSYKGDVTWLDYDPNGRLAVAADDGKIRLYGTDHQPVRGTPLALPNGGKPFGIAFSPDGARLAVGDRQKAVVHIFDMTKLKLERDLAGMGQRAGSFNVVAFAPDGASVFGAGSYMDSGGHLLVHRWDLAGGPGAEFAVAHELITDLLPLRDGLIYASAEPSIGRIDATGAAVAARNSSHIDFRDAGRFSFRLSEDGMVIQLPASRMGTDAATRDAATAAGHAPDFLFNAVTRQVMAQGAAVPRLVAPMAASGGLAIAEWQNSHVPKLNGHVVPLEPAEEAHSVAIAPNGSAAAIGTDFYVRYVAPSGELWKVPATAPVWAVNVSGDGRLVVAALGDGTVHWLSVADRGAERAALFVEPVGGRFVIWTPQGFFDHDHRADGNPDGRSLIGYRFNLPGLRGSAFVEIGQFYPVFFRPDLVGLSLRGDPDSRQRIRDQYAQLGDVSSILAAGLPPRVTLVAVCGTDAIAGAPADCPESSPGAPPVAVRGLSRGNGDVRKPADHPEADLLTAAPDVLVRYTLEDPSGHLGAAIIERNGAVISPRVTIVAAADHSRTEEVVVPLGDKLNEIRIVPASNTGSIEGTNADSVALRVFHPEPEGNLVASNDASPAPGAAPNIGGNGGADVADSGGPAQPSSNAAVAGGGGDDATQAAAPGAAPAQAGKPATRVARPAAPARHVTLYTLSVGVSQFSHPELNLENANNDATSIAKLMSGSSPPVYDDSVAKTLLDDQATSANIIAALTDIAGKAGPDDIVLLFFAGHGVNVDGKYYFIPTNLGADRQPLFPVPGSMDRASAERAVNGLFRQDAVGQEQILALIRRMPATRVALILDTCYSATIATEDAVQRRDVNETVTNALGHAVGRFVLSSAWTDAYDSAGAAPAPGGGPSAPDSSGETVDGHGLFTAFLLKALEGQADFMHAGHVDIDEIAKYTQTNVLAASEGKAIVQEPAYYFAGNDFFALRSTGEGKPGKVN
jgi:WD40 repeat protein